MKLSKRHITIGMFMAISFALLAGCGYDRSNSAVVTENKANDNAYETTDWEPQNNDVGQNYCSRSPNGEVSAEVVRENGYLFDSVLIKRQDRFEELIALEDIFYTNIENTEWLDNTRYAVRGHVNPSLEVYILIDTQKREIISKYYGIGFVWNKNKDRLYYIEVSPNYPGQALSKIINNEGHVYFEVQPGELILDQLAVSDDEQIFTFYIVDLQDESRKLIITNMDRNKKLQKKTTIDAQFGDIEIINNKTIKITPPGGAVYYYEI